MNNPVLTVIIPVFNCEKYVERAAFSVLEQPCGNEIELMLVDDGSTDMSGTLCDAIAAAYQNVKVIHQANAGVSIARNTGIDTASGKYLAFLDADDWWSPNVFDEELKTLITEEPTDLCAFGMRRVSFDMKYHQDCIRQSELIISPQKVTYSNHCSFFYSAEMIRKLGLYFPIAKRWEDPPFVNLSIYFSKSTRCIPKVLSNYWMNPASTLHLDNAAYHIIEKRKALILEKEAYNKLGIEHNNTQQILSAIMELLPQLCVENSYESVKAITSRNEYDLLAQDSILPWPNVQKQFFLWKKHPLAFYIKCQIKPGALLRVKRLFYKTSVTRKLSDWLQYRVIEKWEKY